VGGGRGGWGESVGAVPGIGGIIVCRGVFIELPCTTRLSAHSA
jgi:hypothetical protein